MRLTGLAAITYAAQEGLPLHTTTRNARNGQDEVTLAEATRIAERNPQAIWLEVEQDAPHQPENQRK